MVATSKATISLFTLPSCPHCLYVKSALANNFPSNAGERLLESAASESAALEISALESAALESAALESSALESAFEKLLKRLLLERRRGC